ncbi:MAG: heavy-metal-associated domain-containing protein [Armatimonadota bacterium]|nr:heavy-metal-associated domain-containing protein [bacterium]MDW8321398.1 heavy-metal-associated domain-containing protein [Armatimonadota bacterium]
MYVRLNAPDIVCEGCANAITSALSKLDGVQQVVVDVSTRTVQVQYEEGRIAVDAILQRLDAAGFPATVVV